jgi:hypothetical protein
MDFVQFAENVAPWKIKVDVPDSDVVGLYPAGMRPWNRATGDIGMTGSSRRDFLKYAGAGASTLIAPAHSLPDRAKGDQEDEQNALFCWKDWAVIEDPARKPEIRVTFAGVRAVAVAGAAPLAMPWGHVRISSCVSWAVGEGKINDGLAGSLFCAEVPLAVISRSKIWKGDQNQELLLKAASKSWIRPGARTINLIVAATGSRSDLADVMAAAYLLRPVSAALAAIIVPCPGHGSDNADDEDFLSCLRRIEHLGGMGLMVSYARALEIHGWAYPEKGDAIVEDDDEMKSFDAAGVIAGCVAVECVEKIESGTEPVQIPNICTSVGKMGPEELNRYIEKALA